MPDAKADGPHLTPRNLEVLRLIVAGLNDREIADELSLAYGSVRNHVSRLYKRLGVRNRAEAIRWALQHGIVPSVEQLPRGRRDSHETRGE